MDMMLVSVTKVDAEDHVRWRQMIGCVGLVERKRRRQKPCGSFKCLSGGTVTETLVKCLMYQKFNETKHCCTFNPKLLLLIVFGAGPVWSFNL